MSEFNTNMQILNKLSPTVKISYSKIRGSFETRQNNATKMVDKLYKEILPKFNKHGYITMETLHNSVSKVLNKNINISIRKNNDAIFDGEMIYYILNSPEKFQKQLLTLILLRIKLIVKA